MQERHTLPAGFHMATNEGPLIATIEEEIKATGVGVLCIVLLLLNQMLMLFGLVAANGAIQEAAIGVWSHQTAWDWGCDPTREGIEDRKSKIDNICDEIDGLGDREKLTVGEFESVRHKLNKYGAFPLLDDLRAVTDAVQHQEVRT